MLHAYPLMADIGVNHWRNMQALLLDSAKGTTDTVRGTAEFVSHAAVTPVIRVYGVAAGLRRAAGVLTGLTGADSDKPEE